MVENGRAVGVIQEQLGEFIGADHAPEVVAWYASSARRREVDALDQRR